MSEPESQAAEPTPKRRWCQYSLRTLLAVVTLFALLCGFVAVAMKTRETNRQRDAALIIEKSGGLVRWSKRSGPAWLRGLAGDDYLGHVESVSIGHPVAYDSVLGDYTPITDAGLEQLQRLSLLEKLYIDENQITDAGLERLQGLRQLQVLSLCGNAITDSGLEHLKGLSKLQQLWLGKTQVTEEGVKKLQQALPNCKITK